MLVLFSCVFFISFISLLDGESVPLSDFLLSLGSVEEAYRWMTQDAPSIAEISSGQLEFATLLMEAANVVRKMPGGGGYMAIKALRHYSSVGKDEIAAYHYFMGHTVQYYCKQSFEDTPEAFYCTNHTAADEVIIRHYERARILYRTYGFKGAEFDISGMLNDLGLFLGRRIDTQQRAMEVFEEAIDISPKFLPPVINLALAMEKSAYKEDSRVHALYRQALELAEDSETPVPYKAKLLHNYGTHLYESKLEGYVAAWEEAVRIDPHQFTSHFDLASSYCTAGQIDTAAKVYNQIFQNLLELYISNPNGIVEDRTIREYILLALLHKTTAIIPQIFNSTGHSKDIRRQYISNLMVLDDELRELQIGWSDYGRRVISSSQSEERLGDLIKYANIVNNTHLYINPSAGIGCGAVGYYLIYEGGVDLLPRILLSRIYRAKFPELSYTAPFLRQSHAFNSINAESSRRKFIEFTLSTYDCNENDEVIESMKDSNSEKRCHANSNSQICEGGDQRGQERDQNEMIVYSVPFGINLPKVKIAFLSAYWFRHSVGLLLMDTIRGVSRNIFEVIIISLKKDMTVRLANEADQEDQMVVTPNIPVYVNGVKLQETQNFKKVVVGGDIVTSKIFNSGDEVHLYTVQNLLLMQQSIGSMELDVLVYGEVGMNLETYCLAFSRLAPQTVAFWGHATTSGISSSDIYRNGANTGDNFKGGGIDYYVSSHLFETEGLVAQRKYSERLVLMSGMVSSFPIPPLPLSPSLYSSLSRANTDSDEVPMKRELLIHIDPELDMKLPKDFTLYSIPQTLYKVHPDFDELLRMILTKDTRGYVVVPKGNQNPRWLQILEDRLQTNLGDALLQRIIFLRFMRDREFLALNRVSDVVLDTFPVGGGRSSFEIFSVATPIVVLYPRTSILQLTTGMYKTMGFFDRDDMLHSYVITYTGDDFVNASIEMANDKTRREQVQNLIVQNKARLYTPAESNAVFVDRWEPDYLQDVLDYFHDDYELNKSSMERPQELSLHHSAKIIREWNKLLLFLGSCSKDKKQNKGKQRRGFEYEHALSLQKDINFRISKDGQYLEVLVDEGNVVV